MARVEGIQSPGIDVRVLRHDELERISLTLAHRSPAEHRERLTRQDQGVFTYLVAWDGTEPIGHVGIDWPDEREPERHVEKGGRAIVHDLEVVPARRNRGVGRALMVKLEQCVRERGLSEIGLTTGVDDGYAAARLLYRALGYVERPGTLHIESSRLPSDRTSDVYVEIVTDWTKNITGTGRRSLSDDETDAMIPVDRERR
jgi:GNAT superfamily N-acetyltransferase